MSSLKKHLLTVLYSLALIAFTAVLVTWFKNRKPSTHVPENIDLLSVHEKRLQSLTTTLLSENQTLSGRIDENSNHIAVIVEEIVRLIRETDRLSAQITASNNQKTNGMAETSSVNTHSSSRPKHHQNFIEIPSPSTLNHDP